LKKTIASGAPECLVTVYLKPAPQALSAQGREYFKGTESDESG
jgi:hypothetical protein